MVDIYLLHPLDPLPVQQHPLDLCFLLLACSQSLYPVLPPLLHVAELLLCMVLVGCHNISCLKVVCNLEFCQLGLVKILELPEGQGEVVVEHEEEGENERLPSRIVLMETQVNLGVCHGVGLSDGFLEHLLDT